MNEEENARIAKRRTERLLREAEERRYLGFILCPTTFYGLQAANQP